MCYIYTHTTSQTSQHPKYQTCLDQRTKCLAPNVAIFVKLSPNSEQLLVTDNFLRPVDVRYSEVSVNICICVSIYIYSLYIYIYIYIIYIYTYIYICYVCIANIGQYMLLLVTVNLGEKTRLSCL